MTSPTAYQHWCSQLGGDDPATLRAATNVTEALRQMGRYAHARRLDEDTLERRRRVLGDGPPTPCSPPAISPPPGVPSKRLTMTPDPAL